MPRTAAEHYRAQQRLSAASVRATRVVWDRMGDDLDASWARVGPQLTRVVQAAQLGSARSASGYLDAVLAETGQQASPAPSPAFDLQAALDAIVATPPSGPVDLDALSDLGIDAPPATLQPDAFADGGTSGGGDLQALLDQAVTRAKVGLAQPPGALPRYDVPTPDQADEAQRLQAALDAGQRFLDTVVRSEVADAGRDAVAVGMAIRPKVFGYIRLVNPPCCGRCAILAGQWYGWNEGFLRHPGCDCTHVPAPEQRSEDVAAVPEKLLAAGQIKGLSKADQDALSLGSDLGQVVNARRKGAVSADGLWTREGSTRRGFASGRLRELDRNAPETSARERGRRQRRVMRPTVTNILQNAESREDAISLLYGAGYIL